MRRLPTTARIAALSILLGLLSNLALIGFIRLRTQDDALGALRARVTSQTDVLAEVDRSGGVAALRATIAEMLADDPAVIVALIGRDGRPAAGNISSAPADLHARDFRTGELMVGNGLRTEAGFLTRPAGNGMILLSGRGFDERLTLQRTLERSLLLALFLSLLMGVSGGLLIARYVRRRIEAIVQVVDDVGNGDFTRRAPAAGDQDAFDRLSHRINRMLERIVGLMDELRLITDSLAHDLRSPVSRLRARIERALATEDEAQRELLLSGVIGEADALSRMLATMIEIGRSESLAGRKSFVLLDPVSLTAELAEMYEPLADEAGVTMSLRTTALPPLMGHRQLLAQALSNLIDNALLHGSGGGAVIIAAEAGPSGMVRLSVSDRGPGIAEGDRAEALRRFGRLDTSRSTPGAGLGLALASAVAHLHGGRLELTDGRPGLVASILLPLDTRGAGA